MRPGPMHRIVPSISLVETVTADIRPRAIIDNLLSRRVVFVDADGRFQLQAETFMLRPGGDERLFYFAGNLHDHVAPAMANIAAVEADPFLDGGVHCNGLTPERAAAPRASARIAAPRALPDVNRRAHESTEPEPRASARHPRRVNFGVDVFDESEWSTMDRAA
jgi:hypothetical protein